MCFSATASFVSSGVLLATGIAVTRTAVSHRDKLLRVFPFVFGIQQLIEGVIWLSLGGQWSASLTMPAAYLYIIIAWSGWPVLVPLLYRKHIENRRMTFMNNLLLTVGILISVINLWTLYSIPLRVSIDGYHIFYQLTGERMIPLTSGIMYVLAVLIPPFLTMNRTISLSGAVHVAVFCLSYLLMKQYLVSVWCFMAAISSIMILWVVYTHKKRYS